MLYNSTGYGQDVCFVQGYCQEGVILDHLEALNYFECQIACQDNGNCSYFTFYEPSNLCNLLYNCSDIDTTGCSDCFTGQRDCPICTIPGECVGTISGYVFVPTEEDCQMECFNNDECQWYTFDPSFDYCVLTSNCIPTNTSTESIFGQKNCYQDLGNSSKDSIFRHDTFIA